MQFTKGQLQAKFIPTFVLAGIVTFLIHEAFHWLAGAALGYDMVITPNRVWSLSPMLPHHEMLMSAAGPVITNILAIIGYWKVKNRNSTTGFAYLYMAFFTTLLAMGVSIFNPNDEARISRDLGIGMWTLPTIVVAAQFCLVCIASRKLKLTFRDQFLCYLVGSVVVTLVVGTDYLFFSRT